LGISRVSIAGRRPARYGETVLSAGAEGRAKLSGGTPRPSRRLGSAKSSADIHTRQMWHMTASNFNASPYAIEHCSHCLVRMKMRGPHVPSFQPRRAEGGQGAALPSSAEIDQGRAVRRPDVAVQGPAAADVRMALLGAAFMSGRLWAALSQVGQAAPVHELHDHVHETSVLARVTCTAHAHSAQRACDLA